MALTRGSQRPPISLVCGSCLAAAALADVPMGWLTAGAELFRGGPGLSALTLRALWLLRIWLLCLGAWLVCIDLVRRRAWRPKPFARTGLAQWLYPGAIAAGLMVWTLPLGFVGDDYLWLASWRTEGLGALRPHAGSPHFIPLGLLLCNIPQTVFGTHALPYRLVSLALHATTAGLVARAAAGSGLRPLYAIGAGCVFAATALAYEPLLWATGQYYLWPGVLTAIVFGVLLQPPEDISPAQGWGVALLASVAGFIIEQAAAVTLFVAVWAAVGPGRRSITRVRLPLCIVPVLGGIALVVLRAGTRSADDALVSPVLFAQNVSHVLGGTLLANSPAGHMLGGWIGVHPAGRWAGVCVAAVALVVLARRTGTVGRTVLLGWVLLWLPAILFAPQSSRYWYLPAIPAAIGAMHLLHAWERRLAEDAAQPPWPIGLTGIAVWVVLGAVAMGLRVPEWRAANAVARTVEARLAEDVMQAQETAHLVVAGVPDGVGTDLWPAYVFNNGLDVAVQWALDRRGIAWAGSVELLPGPARPWPQAYTAGGGPGWPHARLDEASIQPDTLVYSYDSAMGTVRPWRGNGH